MTTSNPFDRTYNSKILKFVFTSPDDHFEGWSTNFALEQHTHDISGMLVDSQKLRDLHTALV